jgi:hypothetical protein
LYYSTHADDSNDIRYVYPVATSPKTSDHSEVLEILTQDMHALAQPCLFYDGLTKMFVSMQDQIERQPFNNHLSAGNSAYHARFGYSCDFSKPHRKGKVVNCDDCYNHMKNALTGFPYAFRDCDCCTDWVIKIDTDPMMHMVVPVPPPG